ncbi:MAG: phospholipase D-like domain-containing protein [Chloroflexaceae bacterium]|jgi:cardiolipin synthase|nr:phospholipase D-like domain-containing protein [Chloroflexaceae bacterium]
METQVVSHTDDIPRSDRLNRALTRVSDAPLVHGNALHLLRDGPATYDDWLAAIRGAQRWVHLENYIFHADEIGECFAEALMERAAAGVPVRVVYDWWGSLDVPGAFFRKMRRGGVDVRVFNPFRITSPIDGINRDHRKFVGVDGTYASLGGVCIADEWLVRSPVTGLPYRDTAVRVVGPAVAHLEGAFAAVWRRAGHALPAAEQLDMQQPLVPAGEVEVRVIAQEPARLRMQRVLQVLLAAVEERIWLADAYFLADPILRQALMAAARDGVDVRILLPATNDVPFVGAFSRYGYRPLLEAGVQIWEYAGPMMHAKTTVADGWWSRIGSTNLNPTGLVTNWELDLVAEDRQFGALMEQMYEEDLAHARPIRLTGGGRRRARPTRPESQAERVARRHRFGRISGSGAVVRGVATLQTAGSDTLLRHERSITGGIGAVLVLLSLLAARFPRLLAWPLAAISAVLGAVALAQATRRPKSPRARIGYRAHLRRYRERLTRRFPRRVQF